MAADGSDAAGEAGGLDLEAAGFFEIGADGDDRLGETHALVAALANEFRIGLKSERRKREIVAVESALRQECDGPCGIEFAERLQSRRCEVPAAAVQPRNFLCFDDALERGDRFRRVDAAERFDGFDAKIACRRPGANRRQRWSAAGRSLHDHT